MCACWVHFLERNEKDSVWVTTIGPHWLHVAAGKKKFIQAQKKKIFCVRCNGISGDVSGTIIYSALHDSWWLLVESFCLCGAIRSHHASPFYLTFDIWRVDLFHSGVLNENLRIQKKNKKQLAMLSLVLLLSASTASLILSRNLILISIFFSLLYSLMGRPTWRLELSMIQVPSDQQHFMVIHLPQLDIDVIVQCIKWCCKSSPRVLGPQIFAWYSHYSKTCLKWPPHGARESGRSRQVVS